MSTRYLPFRRLYNMEMYLGAVRVTPFKKNTPVESKVCDQEPSAKLYYPLPPPLADKTASFFRWCSKEFPEVQGGGAMVRVVLEGHAESRANFGPEAAGHAPQQLNDARAANQQPTVEKQKCGVEKRVVE